MIFTFRHVLLFNIVSAIWRIYIHIVNNSIKDWLSICLGSCGLFIPRYDSFPMNPEKKTLIPYIYNASNKDSS